MTEAATQSTQTWREVLDRIEASLAQSLRLAPLPIDRPRPGPSSPPSALDRLEARLMEWQACLDQAESNAATAEATLTHHQGALVDWLEKAREARQRLLMAAEQETR